MSQHSRPSSPASPSTAEVSQVLKQLRQALAAPPEPGVALGTWRWGVRQRMARVRDVLVGETSNPDGWLAARGATMIRERNALLARLNDLGPRVLEDADVPAVVADLDRFLTDVHHHLQRLHDLAYDEVELELGGSE